MKRITTAAKAATATVAYGWAGTPAVTMANAKAWPVKMAGERPTAEMLATAASILRRTGTAKHLALAMYLRPMGATQIEVAAATGDTGVNAYSDAWRLQGWVKVPLTGRNGHKVYGLALPVAKPAKGKGKAAKAATAKGKAGKPASEPATAKGKPAKGKRTAKAATPISEPATPTSEPASEPATAATPTGK